MYSLLFLITLQGLFFNNGLENFLFNMWNLRNEQHIYDLLTWNYPLQWFLTRLRTCWVISIFLLVKVRYKTNRLSKFVSFSYQERIMIFYFIFLGDMKGMDSDLKENFNNIEKKIDNIAKIVKSNAGVPTLGELNLTGFCFLLNRLMNYASRHNTAGWKKNNFIIWIKIISSISTSKCFLPCSWSLPYLQVDLKWSLFNKVMIVCLFDKLTT